MQNLIKLQKPNVFLTYYLHYLQRAKTVHTDTIKYDSHNFYNYQLPNMLQIIHYLQKFRIKFP